ncbi:hypothetical protein DDW44_14310 [Streptomyces tirandamycinicus]|uniref:Uncharacterized protein n=1 Tax=Streptomyces tirandamycinicus TaxID=2174846 RepID=A0A2S1STT3_9ACTN|nr:hypothetical protein DDW44_14310 [Streptomyces tirandamycinicus]
MFDQRALGAHVGGLRPLPRLGCGRALGVTFTLGPDPLQFGLDPLDGLLAMATVAFLLAGLWQMTKRRPGAWSSLTSLTRRLSRTLW